MSNPPIIPELPTFSSDVELTDKQKEEKKRVYQLRKQAREYKLYGHLKSEDNYNPLAQLLHVTAQEMAKRKNGTPNLAGYQKKTSKKSRKRHNSRKKPHKRRTRRMHRMRRH